MPGSVISAPYGTGNSVRSIAGSVRSDANGTSCCCGPNCCGTGCDFPSQRCSWAGQFTVLPPEPNEPFYGVGFSGGPVGATCCCDLVPTGMQGFVWRYYHRMFYGGELLEEWELRGQSFGKNRSRYRRWTVQGAHVWNYTTDDEVPEGSSPCRVPVVDLRYRTTSVPQEEVSFLFGGCLFGPTGTVLMPRRSQWYFGTVGIAPLQVSGGFRQDCASGEFNLVVQVPDGPRWEIEFRAYAVPQNDPQSVCPRPGCLLSCCLPGGLCQHLTPGQCAQSGGISGVGPCATNPCEPSPSRGACCNPLTGGCINSTPGACVSPNTFLGVGTQCSRLLPNGLPSGGPCPQPIGRCCIPDGGGGFGCTAGLTPAQCGANPGGLWGGAGSTCQSSPCPGPGGGGCCVQGSCIQVSSAQQCLNQVGGGVFLGVGSDCQALQCDGACCVPNEQGWTCSEGYGRCQCLNANSNQGIFRGCQTPCPPPPHGPGSCLTDGVVRPMRPLELVLPDGTPASTIGNLRGCSGCKGAKGEAV